MHRLFKIIHGLGLGSLVLAMQALASSVTSADETKPVIVPPRIIGTRPYPANIEKLPPKSIYFPVVPQLYSEMLLASSMPKICGAKYPELRPQLDRALGEWNAKYSDVFADVQRRRDILILYQNRGDPAKATETKNRYAKDEQSKMELIIQARSEKENRAICEQLPKRLAAQFDFESTRVDELKIFRAVSDAQLHRWLAGG